MTLKNYENSQDIAKIKLIKKLLKIYSFNNITIIFNKK